MIRTNNNLSQEQARVVNYNFIQIIKRLDFVDAIMLYGSRARGDNYPKSDIDLAVICPNADIKQWFEVLDIIEDADTLLNIDCVRLDALSYDSPLKKNIEVEGIVIYEKYKS